MVHRNIHYEAAFEDYIRSKGWPYVAVDESKRAIFGSCSIKSFDFIVYSTAGENLLIDVKGRKFPDTVRRPSGGSSKAWENWVTRGDIEGLREWHNVFGQDFAPLFVFAYWLQGPPQRFPFEDVHMFKGNYYGFVGMGLEDYVTFAHPRSAKWQTVSVGSAEFANHVRDIASFVE